MEPMGFFEIYNLLIGLVIAMGAFICKQALSKLEKVREDVHRIETHVPEVYVRRDDYKDDISEIKSMLHHIFSKLDDKADK